MDNNCFQTIEENPNQTLPTQHKDLPIKLPIEARPILAFGKHIDLAVQKQYKLRYQSAFLKHRRHLPRLNKSTNNQHSTLTTPKQSQRWTDVHINNPDLQTEDNNAKNQQQEEQIKYLKPSYQLTKTIDFKEQQFQYAQVQNIIHEFSDLIRDMKVVYMKLDNLQLNIINKSKKRYYASVFLDLKQISKKQKISQFIHFMSKRFPSKIPNNPNQELIFDSNFESGNLFAVYKVSEKQYYCLMQNDINTKGSTQWFYFSVRNKKRIKVRLHIINFYKPSSLYENGMKPVIFSAERNKIYKEEWRRGGQSVDYQPCFTTNEIIYHRLSFIYDFDFPDDKVEFAYCFPYTCSDLKKFVERTSENPFNNKTLKKTVIAKSILDHPIYLLEISSDIHNSNNNKKQTIYIIARQHPGESPGSFVIEGLINTLLSNRIQALELRQKFVFKIVPMVNPDGTAVGNYRSNLFGNDVNRKWDFPSKSMLPEVAAIKKKISEEKKDVHLFLDLHAHSRKQYLGYRRMNSFFYGGDQSNMQHRLFPFVCSKLNKDISYKDSSQSMDQSKRSTARVVCQLDLQIKKSYTFQVSFFGRDRNNRKQHFQKNDYRSLGESLALGMYYTQIRMQENTKLIDKIKLLNTSGYKEQSLIKHIKYIENVTKDLLEVWKKQIIRQVYNKNNQTAGSDSEPQQFQLKPIEIQQIRQIQQEMSHITNQYKEIVSTMPIIKPSIQSIVKTINKKSKTKLYQSRSIKRSFYQELPLFQEKSAQPTFQERQAKKNMKMVYMSLESVPQSKIKNQKHTLGTMAQFRRTLRNSFETKSNEVQDVNLNYNQKHRQHSITLRNMPKRISNGKNLQISQMVLLPRY